jgi:malto-oligosyltrehalose trehalohydrolase
MPETQLHQSSFQFGPQFVGKNQCRFSVWAKSRRRLKLEVRQSGEVTEHQMKRDEHGFFAVTLSGVEHGDEYRFVLNSKTHRPDPAANFYTHDVHQWCKVIDHDRYRWQHPDWRGIEKANLVIYELHIGTFTHQGTFLSTIERLDELVELGVTAIELLPINQCPGRWNWGYDGVGLFSVANNYGTPDHLKQLIDACHDRGLAIILDVVYNHLGPEGNYLSEFASYFTPKHHTPWGSALNFDDTDREYVREFLLANVRYWIQQFRFDGLRLDAVHFMFDDSEKPIPIDIAETFDSLRHSQRRHLHLIGETNVHNASLLKSTSPHGTGFDIVWADGIMHSLLNVAQPGLDVCHRDHSKKTDPGLALQQGYLYENYPYQRHDTGQRTDVHSFVIGLQNHDTVGNHPLGKRVHQLGSIEFQTAAAAVYLLYPAVPMIFMGEEFACENPFLFFVEFGDPRVRDAVEKGRASEFPEMHKTKGVSPLDPQTFYQSKIGPKSDGNKELWRWYQQVIKIRKRFRRSGLLVSKNLRVESDPDWGLFQLIYADDQQQLEVNVRLGEKDATGPRIPIDDTGEVLLGTHTDTATLGHNEAVIVYRR